MDPPVRLEPRVLVAEDDEVNQEIMLQMLESLGVSADVVGDGEAVLAALSGGSYLLVLMDCQMPRMDGYEAARTIREAESGGAHLPIVAVTAHTLAGEREKVLRAGMDDCLTKPVTVRALAETLARFLPETPERRGSSRAPASASEPPLDPRVARSAKVAGLFLKHVPAQLDELARAVAAGDAAALEAAAHKLKGSCAAVGVSGMGALCATLETLAPEEAATHVVELRAAFTRAKTALEEEIAAASAS